MELTPFKPKEEYNVEEPIHVALGISEQRGKYLLYQLMHMTQGSIPDLAETTNEDRFSKTVLINAETMFQYLKDHVVQNTNELVFCAYIFGTITSERKSAKTQHIHDLLSQFIGQKSEPSSMGDLLDTLIKAMKASRKSSKEPSSN